MTANYADGNKREGKAFFLHVTQFPAQRSEMQKFDMKVSTEEDYKVGGVNEPSLHFSRKSGVT